MTKATLTILIGVCLSTPLVGCTSTKATRSGVPGTDSAQSEPSRAAGRPTNARQTGAGGAQTTNRATGGSAGG